MIDVERLKLMSVASRAVGLKVRYLENAINSLPNEQRTVLALVGLAGPICCFPAQAARVHLHHDRIYAPLRAEYPR